MCRAAQGAGPRPGPPGVLHVRRGRGGDMALQTPALAVWAPSRSAPGAQTELDVAAHVSLWWFLDVVPGPRAVGRKGFTVAPVETVAGSRASRSAVPSGGGRDGAAWLLCTGVGGAGRGGRVVCVCAGRPGGRRPPPSLVTVCQGHGSRRARAPVHTRPQVGASASSVAMGVRTRVFFHQIKH